jgi:inner membrane protein
MDALNSYGVHPFWPFNNEWFYGDSVFIVEPLYWVAAAPMFFLVRTIWARVIIGLLLVVAVVANVLTQPARPGWYVTVILLTALLLFIGKRTSARTAALTSAAFTLGFTLMFIFAGRVAAHRVEASLAQSFPSERTIDHVLSPGIANPFCWDVLAVQTRGDEYTLRQALLANAPTVVPVAHCFGMLSPPAGTLPMTPTSVPATSALHWVRQFSMPAERLATLAANDCEARELLQFARVPYATEVEGQWVIGDLRFDRERALGMAELALDGRNPSRCRIHVPWVPPRAALIDNLGASARH